MLPRLPGVKKTLAFTRHVIVYNENIAPLGYYETFAPLEDKKLVKQKKTVPVAITWY